ncbi:MAG TPA: hypothetical protein VF746_03240 [Longimicrobium sp.]|jgi:hypothetical protein
MHGTRIIALVNIDAAGGVDPDRLARALTLTVRRTERGRYAVTGGAERHFVDLIDPTVERCDCGDFTWRQVVCQHLLACLLGEGDERVVHAAGQLVQRLLAENDRLRAELRGRTIVLTETLKRRVAAATAVPVDELEFRRDRDGETSDVTVVRRGAGEVLGRVTRSVSRPEFVSPAPEAADATRIAA